MKRLLPLLSLFLLAGCPGARPHTPPSARSAGPLFEEAAARVGVDFHQRSGATKALNIYQTSAGGCAILDYDGDGWPDLYFVQGQHTNQPGGGNRLYHNRGNGTFEDVTEKASVRGHGYGMGCAVGDFDGDGRPDLYVCNYGVNELFRNRGDGTFEEVAQRTGAAVRGCSVGGVFADLDGDGWPDLYVARYVQINPHSPMFCNFSGVPSSCGPVYYSVQPGVFLHNDHGRFVDRTREMGLIDPGRAMSVAVADIENNNRLAVFIANDTTANALFVGGPGKRHDAATMAGVAYGNLGSAEGNMGCDFGDYDGDGQLDLFVGVMQDRLKLLYHNEGGGVFSLQNQEAGLQPTSNVVTYGAGFLDYNNDGSLDLFTADGHVQSRIHEIEARLSWAQPRQLLENDGRGHFTDRTSAGGPALLTPAVGRGCAFGDLDNDGDVDVVVNNLDGAAMVLMNHAEQLSHHWLRVKLLGKKPDVYPEGTRMELTVGGKRLLRHLHATCSYASASDTRVQFGLGASTSAGPLVVHWRSGKDQEVPVTGVDREITVQEP